jgi:hypothetical protein
LRARLRAGELEPRRVELAAYLGHDAAAQALPEDVVPGARVDPLALARELPEGRHVHARDDLGEVTHFMGVEDRSDITREAIRAELIAWALGRGQSHSA